MFPDVRAWMLNASGITLADLHASITLEVQILLTIPQYVVNHPVHISYSVCRYYSIHCPPPVNTLSQASRSVTTLEPVSLRQATGGILVTPVSAVTRMQLHAARDQARDFACDKCNSRFALPGPVCPTVAVALILIRKLALASAFMSVYLLSAYTVWGIAWLASL